MLRSIGDYFLRGQLFQPPEPPTYSASGAELRDAGVRLTTSDSAAKLPLLEAGSYRSKPRTLILYLHANAVDLGGVAPLARQWADELDAYLIAPEYPGYGVRADEVATVESISRTAREALRYALQLLDEMKSRHPDARLVVVGRSIGTGPATMAVSESNDERIALLVLISPFESVRQLVEDNTSFPADWVVSDFWPTKRNIRSVRTSVLLVHGTDDKVIPIEHSETLMRELRDKADKKLVRVAGGTHNSGVFDWTDDARSMLRARDLSAND